MNDEYSTGESFGENWLLGVLNYRPAGRAHDASLTYSSCFNYDSDLDLNGRHSVEGGRGQVVSAQTSSSDADALPPQFHSVSAELGHINGVEPRTATIPTDANSTDATGAGVDPGAKYTDEPDTKYVAVSNVLCMVLSRG